MQTPKSTGCARARACIDSVLHLKVPLAAALHTETSAETHSRRVHAPRTRDAHACEACAPERERTGALAC
eukprot:7386597-Prymnesium_polylepis.1